MKIIQPEKNPSNLNMARNALELLIAQPTFSESAPCPNCVKHVPSICGPTCPDVGAALSSDPEKFPLEMKVIPFVFELTSTRLMQPCWSCEGHFDSEDKLWKLPQICFYSDSSIYPQLLIRHISELSIAKKIAYEWRLVVSDFGQAWNFSYCMEPNLNRVDSPRLGLLQQDMCRIAENLNVNLKLLAKKMLLEIAR